MPVQHYQYYQEDDILYLQFKDTPIVGGNRIDDAKHLDLDDTGDVRGIVLQGVSDGVDLDGIPETDLPEALRLLNEAGITVKAHALP